MTGRRQSTTESSAGADGARRRWLLDAAGRLRTALDRPAVRASLLSFAWPGLGQLAQRRPAVALVLAVPPLLLLIGVVAWVADAPEVFLLRLLAPGFGLAVVALIGLNAAWRVAAIVDAWLRSASRPLGHERSLPLVVALCLVVVVIHGAAGLYVGSLSPAIQPAFAGDASGVGPIAPPSPAVIEGIVTDVPNWGEWDTDLPGEIDAEDVIPDDGPLNVLILGVDWMPGRTHGLTDTIQVASFDQTSSRSAQISIPRDTGRFELFDGKMYSNRINSLLRYFDRRAEEYPDGAMASMARQIGYLLGIRIHYYALVNIPAFEQLVDMVGGIDYRLEHPIADGKHDFYIAAGKHHLNGRKALMVARSRYGPNNSDYQRARRQQDLLRAIADRLRAPEVAVRLPEILAAMSDAARTNLPLESLAEFVDLLDRTRDADPVRVVLSPPKYSKRIPMAETGGAWMTELKMNAVRELSVELFGEYSRYWPLQSMSGD